MEIKLAAMDTETNNAGGIGQWSLAFRDEQGRLGVLTSYGVSHLKELTKLFLQHQ